MKKHKSESKTVICHIGIEVKAKRGKNQGCEQQPKML